MWSLHIWIDYRFETESIIDVIVGRVGNPGLASLEPGVRPVQSVAMLEYSLNLPPPNRLPFSTPPTQLLVDAIMYAHRFALSTVRPCHAFFTSASQNKFQPYIKHFIKK